MVAAEEAAAATARTVASVVAGVWVYATSLEVRVRASAAPHPAAAQRNGGVGGTVGLRFRADFSPFRRRVRTVSRPWTVTDDVPGVRHVVFGVRNVRRPDRG